jgi:hypothetical protein
MSEEIERLSRIKWRKDTKRLQVAGKQEGQESGDWWSMMCRLYSVILFSPQD